MSTLPITLAFTRYLTEERHFSPYTARCYGADLRQLVEYLSDELGVEIDEPRELAAMKARENGSKNAADGSITATVCKGDPDTIRNFLAHLGEQQYSPATMGARSRLCVPSTSGPTGAGSSTATR